LIAIYTAGFRRIDLRTILLVDDDESIRLLLRDEFCDKGFNVLTAVDGEEGLISFGENDIDIIILDLDIPKVAGMEFIDRLKVTSPETPVIIYTANPHMVEDTSGLNKVSIVFKSSDVDDLVDSVLKFADV